MTDKKKQVDNNMEFSIDTNLHKMHLINKVDDNGNIIEDQFCWEHDYGPVAKVGAVNVGSVEVFVRSGKMGVLCENSSRVIFDVFRRVAKPHPVMYIETKVYLDRENDLLAISKLFMLLDSLKQFSLSSRRV